MLYGPDDYQLMLVDHVNSFGTQKGRPAYLGSIELTIAAQWRIALLGIDDETLRVSLGEVLDKKRLSALGKRRDMLLENPN